MAGLGGGTAPQDMMQGQNAQAPMPQDMGAEAGGVSQASAEEQALYNRFVSTAVIGLSDEKMLPQTVEALNASDDPVANVAQVASAVIMRVSTMAQEQGAEIPGDVMMHGGKEVIEYTVELAEAAGVGEFSEDMLEAAFYQTLDIVTAAMKSSGDLNEEKIAADLPMAQQMQESGELDRMLAQMQQDQQGGAPVEEEMPPQGKAPMEEEL